MKKSEKSPKRKSSTKKVSPKKLSKKSTSSPKYMDTLYFYSKSADRPAGRGANEHAVRPEDYKDLNAIPHWRKVLSNFYEAPFTYDGKTYRSVEHAFQGAKIALVNKEKGSWFTVESGHAIGQGDGLVARKNRKLIELSKNDLMTWNERKHKIMEEILFEKFTQVPLANQVLRLTRNAVLLHSTRGPPIRQVELETVRARIQ
jgi:predicted NAD-dependent protein-ADP-ribosyltransferase YbiA (DUF1768 family)